jgi:hypothetical protein
VLVAAPAGRIIADVGAVTDVRMTGTADPLDPGWGGGALPFDLIGCTPPPIKICCAPALA